MRWALVDKRKSGRDQTFGHSYSFIFISPLSLLFSSHLCLNPIHVVSAFLTFFFVFLNFDCGRGLVVFPSFFVQCCSVGFFFFFFLFLSGVLYSAAIVIFFNTLCLLFCFSGRRERRKEGRKEG